MDIASWGDYKIVWVDSDAIDQSLAFVRDNELDGIGISKHIGYKRDNLDFLAQHTDVRGVFIANANGIDLDGLYAAQEIEALAISGATPPFDASRFPRLRDLNIQWHSKLTLPSAKTPLQSLTLRQYNAKSSTLDTLPAYTSLASLTLVQGTLESLNGLSSFKALEKLSVNYLTKLIDISALETANNLVFLHLEKCKKIDDLAASARAKNLQTLQLYDCGSVQSLSFLNELPALRNFSFVKTRVEDGDLSPVLRLENVGFLKMPHYSHTQEQVNREIAQRKDI